MLKVVFLDVDGVLCCNDYSALEKPKLKALEYLCHSTGAWVCVSSDWRLYPSKKRELMYALKQMKIKVIGCTPTNNRFARPKEIIGFITVFNARMNSEEAAGNYGAPKIKNFVTLDDRHLEAEEGGERLLGKCIRTDKDVGLTMELATHAISILNEER